MKQLLIIGAGGHGRVVADMAQLGGQYERIIFFDDADITTSGSNPVIGKVRDALKHLDGNDVVVAVGNNQTRQSLCEWLESHLANIVSVIHPSAIVASNVSIGKGTVVMANAVIQCGSRIGKGVIVNTAATIDHDCVIADYVHLSPGVHLSGTVSIGERTWLGIGSLVSNNVSICKNCVVGAGGVVVKPIVKRGTYIGVPVQEIQTKKEMNG